MIFEADTQQFTNIGKTICSHVGAGCALFYSPIHKNRPTVFIGGSRDTLDGSCAEVFDYKMANSTWEKRKCFVYNKHLVCQIVDNSVYSFI
jgi:hypothetical protein